MDERENGVDMGRVLGIDYGDRRVGLALSDPSGTLARPLRVVEVSPRLSEELRAVVRKHSVTGIVLGFPRNMDGSIGPKARQVLEFKAWLERELGLPVDLWDERLSTVQATRILRSAGVSAGRRSGKVDKLAAHLILQSYLDAKALGEGKSCPPGSLPASGPD